MAFEETSRSIETRVTSVAVERLAEGESAPLPETGTDSTLPKGDGKDKGHFAPANPQGLLHHRVREIAWHIPWYGFKTQARLAKDSGVSPSTISRLMRGRELPSLLVTLRLTDALAARLGRPLDVREVFSLDGLYPHGVCQLASCRGCQAPTAFDKSDNSVPGAPGMERGQWVRSLTPSGAANR